MLADIQYRRAGPTTVLALRFVSVICRAMLAVPVVQRAAWRFMPALRRLFSHDIEVKTTFAGGVQFHAVLSDHIESQIFWQGVQEGDRNELALILKLIEPGQVFFDVGANVGTFTLPAAARLKYGQVHAFEPWYPHLVRLHRNIELNGYQNIIVNDCALCRTDGEVTLNVPAGSNPGMASIYRDESDGASKARITCKSLDSYVAARNPDRLDLIKIDVEGAELDVLEGGVATLRRFRPRLIVEVAESNLRRAGRFPNDVFEFFAAIEYRLFTIGRNASLAPAHEVTDLCAVQNVYCVPRQLADPVQD